jgi:hypothetical protein
MAGESFIRVPADIGENPIALQRFLLALVEYLDIAFGNRGSNIADKNKVTPLLTLAAADLLYTNNPKQDAIANLGLTISNPPTQAQVQAVANKVDQIITALTAAKII